MPPKCTRNNENLVFNNIDTSAPPPKRTRRVLVKLSPQELQAEQARLVAEQKQNEAQRTKELQSEVNAKANQQQSARVSRMLGAHGGEILALMHQRCPDVMRVWAVNSVSDMVAREGKVLAEFLRPSHGEDVSEILGRWSLDRIQTRAQDIAPTLCKLLEQGGFNESLTSTRRNHGLVFTTILCMLAQSHTEHSNEFQTMMCIYLLACGASHSMFEVLHHTRITSSYTKAVYCLKKMGTEHLNKIEALVKVHLFMIVWDNLNIAFRVSEQRKDSKDHFDNGTTATLIPLIDIPNGHLSLYFLPPRLTRLPIINFGPQDLLPSLEQFADNIKAPPVVLSIPVHQTEQYPLPAMHIDESSIDGALEVIDSIVRKTLKMSSEDIQKHGIIMCAGDQLTVSLLDKATASRHDDSDLFDNVGSWTHPQLGLFHVKLAATRMVINEFSGTANSKSPWSLWRVNSLLGRKAISAGWKVKKLPPFRPSWDLILALALPANILDTFRLTKEMPPAFEDPPDGSNQEVLESKIDLGCPTVLELDDLTLDDEEYIPDLDQEDLQFITQEMIDVLSKYDR
ncbi:hypothetical protein C8R48DRAFT_667742 [Suillus tomentosus]|nr:hypothetical protein C8R48DRAFT_667742 [Suillus tomentosus]